MRHRVRSEQGASLSMALMVFLVCTVAASIAIAAASTTSGRLAEYESLEKSYYNVTSAASLIWDELKGGVTVELVRECDATASPSGGWTDPTNWKCTVDGTEPPLSSSNSTLFQMLTYDLAFNLSETSFTNEHITNGGGIDFSRPVPMPLVLTYTDLEYQSFEIKPSSSIPGAYGPVNVTIHRNKEDETFSFVFSDLATDTTYTIYATVQSSTNFDSSTSPHLKWTTTFTWTPLYFISGDV